MNALNHIAKLLLFPVFAVLFMACTVENNKDEFEVFADAYIVKKKVNGVAGTANAYYAYGNNSISSVTVTPPDGMGGSVSLAAKDELNYNYYYEPDSGDFNTEPPVPGKYIFELESARGEKMQADDYLEVVNMSIPEIVSSEYHSNTLSLSIKWNTVTGADGIAVKLLDMEGNNIFISYGLSPSVTEIIIGTGGGTWISTADIGEKLLLQVQTFTIEKDADEEYDLYNIAGIAIAEKKITWGE